MSFDTVAFCNGTFEDNSIEAGLCLSFARTNDLLLMAKDGGGGGANLNAAAAESMEEIITGLNIFFLLFAGSFIFMMQTGFAMLCAGSIRQKNVKNIMLTNYLDSCIGAVGFWSVGYAFAFGGASPDKKSFIGNQDFFLANVQSGTELITWFFQFAMAATAATIVAGTVAERCKTKRGFSTKDGARNRLTLLAIIIAASSSSPPPPEETMPPNPLPSAPRPAGAT